MLSCQLNHSISSCFHSFHRVGCEYAVRVWVCLQPSLLCWLMWNVCGYRSSRKSTDKGVQSRCVGTLLKLLSHPLMEVRQHTYHTLLTTIQVRPYTCHTGLHKHYRWDNTLTTHFHTQAVVYLPSPYGRFKEGTSKFQWRSCNEKMYHSPASDRKHE